MPTGVYKRTDKHNAAISKARKGVATNPTGILIPKSVSRRKSSLKYRYGKSISEYQHDLDTQNGICAICWRAPKDGEYLAYDHDHLCHGGEKSCSDCLRGLLCRKCNTVLGLLDDNVVYFERAIEYLKLHARKTE